MKRIELGAAALVVALGFAIISCDQSPSRSSQSQTAQSTVTAGTTTATATAKPTPPSPPQIFAEATAAFVTPVGVGVARTDCTNDSVTYTDPSTLITVCAPRAAVVVADITPRGEPGITLASDLAGRFSKDLPQFAVAARVSGVRSGALSCSGSGGADVVLEIGPLRASGCQFESDDGSPVGPLSELHLSAELSPAAGETARFLNVYVSWRVRSAGAEDLARDIARSLRLAQP